ncbi:protein DWD HYPERSENSITIVE TO UV-B 1-like isoform X2 [Rutidosis leptorrhynchoides]|uniref:protein DWD HYPERSENSITIVE TO UV-B 1-like isoform X2 n=1 Tax=Rutidosis leptorrhynchoides TaxID=125765 RepID=UPI003A98FCD0
MAIDIQTLKHRYIDSCKDWNTVPNKAVFSAFVKAEVNKLENEESSFSIFLDDLEGVDFHPLYNVFVLIDMSEIDAVDILQKSSCSLDADSVLLLLHAVHHKLRVVDLQDRTFGKDFLLGLSSGGLACQVLHLKFSHFRKVNMTGKFMQMRTLNLDFSASLTSFGKDCFSCTPNLKCLSLCATKISNLWTTSASLAKLPSLTELRFQSCLCRDDTKACPRSFGAKPDENTSYSPTQETAEEHTYAYPNDEDELINLFLIGTYNNSVHGTVNEYDDSTDSEVDFSDTLPGNSLLEDFSWNGLLDLRNEIFPRGSEEDADESWAMSRPISRVSRRKHRFDHPSPICYEKHYRDYMIASFPNLKILDNQPIRRAEKDRAAVVYSDNFEHLPYKRTNKESIVSILKNREIKAAKNTTSYTRSVGASRVGCAVFPSLRPLSIKSSTMPRVDVGTTSFRPRQFEYHPCNSNLMVIGTLDGEVVVVNHESEKIVGYISSHGATNSVLGLCWLKKYPSKLIAGSDNGVLKLYDIQHTPSTAVTFDGFDQLTSVHVNSLDELFLASGYSNDVALYDISTGQRLQRFSNMHQEHINVVKFANHSPSMFATSSFDHDVKMWDLRQKPIHPCYTVSSFRGNVMVCFSPDDHYLLVSAVDNEVKQLLAVDGRLHLDFGIAPTRSSQNYTRSYYMNGGDYILSGSCDENVVRICCAQTGRRLRDISLEGKSSGSSMFVQSLRGDPFRDFNLSVLAAYYPSSRPEIVKINMLSSKDADKDSLSDEHLHAAQGLSGA